VPPKKSYRREYHQKNKNKPAKEGLEDVIHDGLKSGWRVSQSKGHNEELEVPVMSAERCLRHIIRVHTHLMVPAAEIDLGEEARPLELIQEFIDHRNWKLVLHRLVIQLPEVDTKTLSLIVLLD
jgi:hypothetical protein